jgi:hypothetical protein
MTKKYTGVGVFFQGKEDEAKKRPTKFRQTIIFLLTLAGLSRV